MRGKKIRSAKDAAKVRASFGKHLRELQKLSLLMETSRQERVALLAWWHKASLRQQGAYDDLCNKQRIPAMPVNLMAALIDKIFVPEARDAKG